MINIVAFKRHIIDLALDGSFCEPDVIFELKPFKKIASIYTGDSTNDSQKQKYSNKVENSYPYVATKDISKDGKVNYDNGMYIPKTDASFEVAPFGSVLLCIEGGNAGNKLAILDRDVCFVNKLCCFAPNDVESRYIYYYLQSNQFRKNFKGQMTGLIGGVSIRKIKDLQVPVPSKLNQQMIVDKLDAIFSNLDIIAEKQDRLMTIKEKLESKVIDLAIQGLLVNQAEEDGTANQLFNEIQNKKADLVRRGIIRRDSLLSKIDEKDFPFVLPRNWKWCKFGDLISLTSGVDLTSDKYYPDLRENSIPYITGASCIDDNGTLIINRYTGKENANSSINDLLLTCKGTIGKISINNVGEIHLARQLMGIKTFINQDYSLYFLKHIVNKLRDNANGLIPGIDRPTVRNYLIALPPLKEQERIVAKINDIMSVLGQIIK